MVQFVTALNSGQVYQVKGGVRVKVVSITPDEQTCDDVLVLESDQGGPQLIRTVSEFFAQGPELVAAPNFVH